MRREFITTYNPFPIILGLPSESCMTFISGIMCSYVIVIAGIVNARGVVWESMYQMLGDLVVMGTIQLKGYYLSQWRLCGHDTDTDKECETNPLVINGTIDPVTVGTIRFL